MGKRPEDRGRGKSSPADGVSRGRARKRGSIPIAAPHAGEGGEGAEPENDALAQKAIRRRAFLVRTVAMTAGPAALAALQVAEAHAQGGGAKVTTTRDWFLVTDKSRSGGIFLTGQQGPVVVTQAFVKGFEATYFDSKKTSPPTPAELRAYANGVEGSTKGSSAEMDQAITQLATMLGALSVSTTAQAFGTLDSKVDRAPGWVKLGGRNQWRPGGELRTRTVGSATTSFLISPTDLRGSLTPSTRFGGIGLTAGLPSITTAGNSCGVCGVCGLCALCALCAEINFGVVGAAGAAAVAATNASSIAFTPASLDPLTNRLPPGTLDVQRVATDVRRNLDQLTLAVGKVRPS
jgi:hypothetical protein